MIPEAGRPFMGRLAPHSPPTSPLNTALNRFPTLASFHVAVLLGAITRA